MGEFASKSADGRVAQLAFKLAGIAIIAMGVLGIVFGSLWAPTGLNLFSGIAIRPILDPFVPFFPVFLIVAGAFLLVRSKP
jgi:hypothetical protein